MATGVSELLDEIEAGKPEPSANVDAMIEENQKEIAAEIEAEKAGEEPATESAPASAPAAEPNYSGLIDDRGNQYDANSHASPPAKTKDGTWAKKRGRKTGQVYAGSTSPQTAAVSSDPLSPDAARRSQCEITAAQHARHFFALAIVIFHDEGKPLVIPEIGLNEPLEIRNALADYYYEYGEMKLPPWLGLLMVMGGFAVRRFQLPKTQSRWAKFWGQVKAKMGWTENA
jgi:hypothetical protein